MTPDDPRAAARRAHALGRRGEEIAAQLLVARGFVVRERNARLARAEFDLVAEDREGVAFVEVKSRTGTRFGEPWQAVDDRTRDRRVAAAMEWLARAGRPDADFRFGVVSLVFDAAGGLVSSDWIDESAS
ncbi:MAG: YraN family protein [Planctomycetota bacterium JB042]